MHPNNRLFLCFPPPAVPRLAYFNHLPQGVDRSQNKWDHPPPPNPLSTLPPSPLPRERLVDVEVAKRAGIVSIQPVVDLAHVKPVEAREDSHAIPGLVTGGQRGPLVVLGETERRSRQTKKGERGTVTVTTEVHVVLLNVRCKDETGAVEQPA